MEELDQQILTIHLYLNLLFYLNVTYLLRINQYIMRQFIILIMDTKKV